MATKMSSQKTTPRTKDGYVEGAIIKVKLKHFMTYSSVEFRPGPRMNIIVGPNGTGKSAILCAICLALGGKPSLIGRANAVGDYIMRGHEKSTVEVELCNAQGPNFVIRRIIQKNNQSTWFLNGNQTTQKSIDGLMVQLNIQMQNLCQFLPQDRVVDFVRMTPQELLENTEKAAGTPEMWEQHCKLRDWNKKAIELEKDFDRIKEDLGKEMQKQNRLEEQKRMYEEKKRHKEKIELLKKKRVWLQYHEANVRYVAEKKVRDKKSNELRNIEAELQPLKLKVEECVEQINEVKGISKTMSVNVRMYLSRMKDEMKEVNKCIEKEADWEHDFKAKKRMEEERVAKLHTLERQLQSFQNDLDGMKFDDQLVKNELQQVADELRVKLSALNEIQVTRERKTREKDTAEIDLQKDLSELKKIKDVTRARLEMLRNRHRHTYEATLWLRENRMTFKRPIHEPIMTVLNIPNSAFAKYVEHHIAFKDLIAFVCEDPDDLERFMSQVRDKQNLKINVVLAPTSPASQFQPDVPLESIRQWGFHSYLREMVEAPEAVLRYLCSQYNIHRIPVGNERTKQLVEQVLQESNFRQFYTADHQYSCSQSRYGDRTMSTRSTQLRASSLLNQNVDVVKEKQIEASIQQLREVLGMMESGIVQMQQDERNVNKEIEALRQKKKELLIQKDARGNLMAKIEREKLRIQSNKESKIDLEMEKEKFRTELRKLNGIKINHLKAHVDKARSGSEANCKWIAISCQLNALVREKSKNEKIYRESSSALPGLRREVELKQNEVMSLMTVAKQLLEKAKKMTGVTGTQLPKALQRSFDLLPTTLEELESQLHQIQAESDCMAQTSENIVEEYERWKEMVKSLQDEEGRRRKQLESYERDMTTIEQSWLPPLNQLITDVSCKFSGYFQSLGCAGEVMLKKGEREKDYNAYGICIKVKYRDNEPLRELTQHFQSGGERSVATILYLLALQEFISLPFCCVDEINQGMDSTNEQRVLQLMTETLCDQSISQYFLVTPKLLLTSNFDNNVTFHWVYNGNIQGKQWNTRDIINRRRNLV